MKLSLTTTQVIDLPVARTGQTIGSRIDDEIRIAMENGLSVSNVSVDVSTEDMIALNLLRAPAFENFEVPVQTNKPKLKSKFWSSQADKQKEQHEINQQFEDGLITESERDDLLRTLRNK